jgi:hypothetical protein
VITEGPPLITGYQRGLGLKVRNNMPPHILNDLRTLVSSLHSHDGGLCGDVVGMDGVCHLECDYYLKLQAALANKDWGGKR